jgi:hypothetical protein
VNSKPMSQWGSILQHNSNNNEYAKDKYNSVPQTPTSQSTSRPVQRGALFYSAGFNVNQNFKEKIFLNNSMFQFFS